MRNASEGTTEFLGQGFLVFGHIIKTLPPDTLMHNDELVHMHIHHTAQEMSAQVPAGAGRFQKYLWWVRAGVCKHSWQVLAPSMARHFVD